MNLLSIFETKPGFESHEIYNKNKKKIENLIELNTKFELFSEKEKEKFVIYVEIIDDVCISNNEYIDFLKTWIILLKYVKNTNVSLNQETLDLLIGIYKENIEKVDESLKLLDDVESTFLLESCIKFSSVALNDANRIMKKLFSTQEKLYQLLPKVEI